MTDFIIEWQSDCYSTTDVELAISTYFVLVKNPTLNFVELYFFQFEDIIIAIYKITEILRAFWLVKNLLTTVPVNS